MDEGRLNNTENVEYKTNGLTVPCHPCSKKNERSDAVIYCADCDEVQCSVCAKDHATYVVMGHHVTVDINEWRKSNDFFDLAKISQCEIHGISYEFYCEHDSRLCCKYCLDQFHHSCRNVLKISTIDHKIPDSENGIVHMKLRSLLDKTERIASQSEEHKGRIKSQVSLLPNNIDSMRRKVLEIFDKFEEKVLEEANIHEAAQSVALDEIKRHTFDVAGDIQNTWTNIKCLPQSMTPSQHFIFEKKMDEILKRYDNKVEIQATDLRNLDKDISVQFSNKLKELVLSTPDELGSINTDQEEKGSDHFPEPNAAVFKHVAAITPPSPHLNPLYIGMDFLKDDRLVLADKINKTCVIMNISLKVVGEKHLGYAPQNLLVFGEDELFVSSGEKQFIDYFGVNAENILIHIKRINTMLPCDSMSVISDKIFAIGVASGNRPSCKLSLTNTVHFSDFNIDFERGRYKLGETKCVFCPRLELLVLTDKVTDTVSLINTKNGERIQVKDKVIKAPRCAVIGKDESIFVSCEGSCCLVQLSPYGEILSFRKLQMSFPYSICISKDKSKIAVSNRCVDECKIQVFSLT